MNRHAAERKLAELGFKIDWNVTGVDPEGGGWVGVIDPVGRNSILGDCFGPSIDGANAADWYKNAIAEAQKYTDKLVRCADPSCDYHADATE